MSEQTEKVIELHLFLWGEENPWRTVKGRTEKDIEEAICKPYGLIEEDCRVLNSLIKQDHFASLGIKLNDQELEIRNAKNQPFNMGQVDGWDWNSHFPENDDEEMEIRIGISKIGSNGTYSQGLMVRRWQARFAIIGLVVSYQFGLDMAKLASKILCNYELFCKLAMKNEHWLLDFERIKLNQT